MPNRILLLTTPNSYRDRAFVDAAGRLGVEIVTALDLPSGLAGRGECELAVDFEDFAGAAAQIADFAAARPIDAIIAVDDSGSLLAAHASDTLGLPHNAPAAAEAARDKYIMRTLLARHGV